MNNKSLKYRLRSGQLTLGSWITVDNEIVAEIMARQGFDWLTIDIEHSAIEFGMVQRLVRTIELNGCIPLVRVGENDANLIKRVMDTGAHGVIVPMVKTAEDARRAVSAVRYPPQGERGVGLSRAQGYGRSFDKYRQWLAKESVVIAIIEHVDAIDNLEDILSVEGIDATMIGPYDLSGSMGHPGEFTRKDVQAVIRRYIKTCQRLKKTAGFHVIPPNAKHLNEKIAEGFRFLALSLDSLLLSEKCRQEMALIKGGKKRGFNKGCL